MPEIEPMYDAGDGERGREVSHAADAGLLRRHGACLLEIAGRSVDHGLEYGGPLAIDPDDYPEDIGASRATFVTLRTQTTLRGCVGSVTAWRSLVSDVSYNAFGAAFGDSRFASLTADERPGLELSISLLSPFQALDCTDERDLLARLRPGADGLMIEDQGNRAIFLPTVWRMLPRPEDFLVRLKRKAGMADDHWSPHIRAHRFVTSTISTADSPAPVRNTHVT